MRVQFHRNFCDNCVSRHPDSEHKSVRDEYVQTETTDQFVGCVVPQRAPDAAEWCP